MKHSHEIDTSDLENITVGFALEIHSLFLQLNGKQKTLIMSCLGKIDMIQGELQFEAHK